ncbi:hypothetical protein ACI79G_04475 [Geodermatophilus sp. SYSU D00779]
MFVAGGPGSWGGGGAHPLVGPRAPDVTADDGTRLYEALRRGRSVLAAPPGFAPAVPGVTTVDVTGAATALLVRPDGDVAWAGRTPAGLGTALADWAAAALGATGARA